MMNKETGGPAFPSANAVTVGEYVSSGHSGMTLRDYFAAKAMQGKLAGGASGSDYIAMLAYEYADAMLKAREE
jgi:hypothetical protein